MTNLEAATKTAEMIAHRAVEDLALEAENSVAEMLRLVDRMHRADRPHPVNPSVGEAFSAPVESQKQLSWDACLDTFVILHPKCKKEYVIS